MKKTPAATEVTTSAQDKRQFTGTDNPRHLRAISALLAGPISRHDLAQVAGVANAPELVAELRRRGLTIPCTLIDFIDRDGCKCRPGVYSLTTGDRRAIYAWMAKRERKEVLL